MQQTTSTLLMVAPDDFGFNEQTAADNEFQHRPTGDIEDLRKQVMAEFETSVDILHHHGVEVLVLRDAPRAAPLPDAVFPNNWISTEDDGRVALFPMATPNRRAETAQWPYVAAMLEGAGLRAGQVIDLADGAQQDRYLEGTGSLILDRVNRVAYAAISVRTDADLVKDFARQMGYDKVVTFRSQSRAGDPFYHTNVVMSVGTTFAVACLEAIPDKNERLVLMETLVAYHELIPLNARQTEESFCANLLEVSAQDGTPLIVLSQTALDGMSPDQKRRLEAHAELVPLPIRTIEHIGGGSARCMMAEIFLPRG